MIPSINSLHHEPDLVQRARTLDEKGWETSRKQVHDSIVRNEQSPMELDGHHPADVMAALDVLASRPEAEGWTDESAPLDPFGITVIIRVGEYVALNSQLEGVGFTRYPNEAEAIRAYHKTLETADMSDEIDFPEGLPEMRIDRKSQARI